MDWEQAEEASKTGAYVVFFMAGYGLILHAYLIFYVRAGDNPLHNFIFGSPWSHFRTIVDIILGYGLLKYSRTAAVSAFLIFAGSIVYSYMIYDRSSEFYFTLVTLYFLGNAIRGTFIYHKFLEEEDDEEYEEEDEEDSVTSSSQNGNIY